MLFNLFLFLIHYLIFIFINQINLFFYHILKLCFNIIVIYYFVNLNYIFRYLFRLLRFRIFEFFMIILLFIGFFYPFHLLLVLALMIIIHIHELCSLKLGLIFIFHLKLIQILIRIIVMLFLAFHKLPVFDLANQNQFVTFCICLDILKFPYFWSQ